MSFSTCDSRKKKRMDKKVHGNILTLLQGEKNEPNHYHFFSPDVFFLI